MTKKGGGGRGGNRIHSVPDDRIDIQLRLVTNLATQTQEASTCGVANARLFVLV